MTILTKDTRGLTDIEPINLDIDGIVFYDLKITWNGASAFLEMVKWNYFFSWSKTQKIEFDGERSIFDIGNNHFVVEYSNESERERDIRTFRDKFIQDEKTTQSLPVSEGKQEYIPEYDGKFEYDKKFYVILHARHKLWETNADNGVYRGMIVNTDVYFSDKAQRQVEEWAQRVEDTLWEREE